MSHPLYTLKSSYYDVAIIIFFLILFRLSSVYQLKVLHSVGKTRRGKKIVYLIFIFLDTLMMVKHNPIKVRSGMPAFSRNHMFSVDFRDLSGTR